VITPTNQVDAEIEQYVLDALKRQKDIQDVVIPYIIKKRDWDWKDCEKFIEKIRNYHRDELSRWQGNFYSILSYCLLAFGLALVLISFEVNVGFDRLFHCAAVEIDKVLNGVHTTECSTFGLEVMLGLSDYYTWFGIFFTAGGIIGAVLAGLQKQRKDVIKND